MNMLKTCVLGLVLLTTLSIDAQVAINPTGNAPDSSAMLEIQSTDKGLLIPRMTTAQRTAINSPATGLMVFDTDTGSFWFWDGSVWTQVGTGHDWSLTGNAGTVDSINFIGTTDDVPLNFRVNNERGLRIEYARSVNKEGDTAVSSNIIGGFSGNSVAGGAIGSTISGGGTTGVPNTILASFATISGGINNTVNGGGAVISGGFYNSASGLSNIGGGGYNITDGGVVAGGEHNSATGSWSTVGGGLFNEATDQSATLAGGEHNSVSGLRATVGGGSYNNASGENATIAGGGGYNEGPAGNSASGLSSAVPGGSLNSASGDYSFASGRRAKIAAAHDGAFLFADQNNFDFNSIVANEFAVRATGGVRFVTKVDSSGIPIKTVSIDDKGGIFASGFTGNGSGLSDLNAWGLTGTAGTVDSINFIGTTDDVPINIKVNNLRVGRFEHAIETNGSTQAPNIVFGAEVNMATGYGGTVGGGGSLLLGGNQAGNYATVSGGAGNQANSAFSAIGGGNYNIASESSATIGGGDNNVASGTGSAIAGGISNYATASFAAAGGGNANGATGISSAIGGGAQNQASGLYSAIPGGNLNMAAGDYSVATGRRAKIDAAHDGTFLFADQNNLDFNSLSPNEFAARATGGVRFVTAIDGSGNPTQTISMNTTGTVNAAAFVGDGSGLTNLPGDNLGNHTAMQTVNLNGHYLSGDGDSEGLSVDNSGNIRLTKDDPVVTFYDNTGSNGDRKSEINATLASELGNDGPEHQKLDFNVSDGGIGTSTVMTLRGDGHVGISTTNPDRPLAIKGAGALSEWISLKDNTGTTQWHLNQKDGGLNFAETGAADGRLFLDAGGNIGIGTTNPTNGKVQILGQSGSVNLSYGYLNSSGNTGTGSGTDSYSLYCSNRIAAQEFRAHSDMRIKNIKGISDAGNDLQTLMQIEITDYTMRDTVANGATPQKKVIAQQVERIYPQAVTSNLTEVVPDIYQKAEVKNGWIILSTNLKPGERVKIITEESAEVYAVLEAESTRFKVDGLNMPMANSQWPMAFVYGREVHDFHTVDYEAIAMLNVSATQEQQRIIEAQNQRILELEQRVSQIEKLGALISQLQQSITTSE